MKDLIQLAKMAAEYCKNKPEFLSALKIIIRDIEEMPIHWDSVLTRPLYFVESGGEWWPCTGQELKNDWTEYRIEYMDGSVDSGVAQKYNWAHCTGDNLPNYHWYEELIDSIEGVNDVNSVGCGKATSD